MFETNTKNLFEHLKYEMNIEPNAIIWLHSGVLGLGLIKNGIKTITDVFEKLLPEGALVIPTFTYSWCKGELYNPTSTECWNMGVYAKDAWKDPRFVRTENPNFSVAVMDNTLNKQVSNSLLKNEPDETCFGKNSSFEKISVLCKDKPGHILLLGGAHHDVIFRTTFLHLIEESVGVPYRYSKKFYDKDNQDKNVKQYVRYLSKQEYIDINKKNPPPHFEFPITPKYNQLGIDLKKESLIKIVKFGYSETRIVPIFPFCNWLQEKLKNDPEYLIN